MRWQWPVPVRREPPVGTRWAALVAVLAGLAGAAAFPRLGIWPLAAVSVAGLSWAVDGRRTRTALGLGLLLRAGVLRPAAALDRHLRRRGALADPRRGRGCVPGRPRRRPCRSAAPARCAVLGGVRLGAARGAARPAAVRRFPVGTARVQPVRFAAALVHRAGRRPAAELRGGAERRRAVAARCAACGRSPRRRVAAGVAVAVALPLAGLVWTAARPDTTGDRALPVAIVQGSVPDRGLAFEDRARQVLDNHVAQTMRLAAQIRAGEVPQPRLVVWPENSSDVDPLVDRSAGAEISRAVQRRPRSGARRRDPGRPGTGPPAQRRHPLVAHPRPGCDVRQAAPGALRRVHPAAQPGREGELGGQARHAGHGRRHRQRSAARRPGADRRRDLLRGRLRRPRAVLGRAPARSSSSSRPTTRRSGTPRRPTSSSR